MAKTIEDLEKSQKRRKEIIEKYGCVPTSVWDISFTKNKLIWDPRPKQNDNAFFDPNMSKELNKIFRCSGISVRGKGGGQSVLPYDMMERVLKFYSEERDTVLDPTMGDPTAMTVTYQLNRNFIGYDISKENFNINAKLKDRLLGLDNQAVLMTNEAKIDIYNQSSENMNQIKDNSVDLVFFTPPYWDTEFYGEEPEQLGYNKTYNQFLEGLGKVINETFRCLKVGKFCCININDFRKEGRFYDFHSDVITLMNKAGYKRHDTIIIVWPNCVAQAFASQVEDRKTSAKKHEYLLVGKKI